MEYVAVPPRVNRMISAPLAHNKTPIILIPEVTDGGRPPFVKGAEFGARRIFVSDTGCSSDSAPVDVALFFCCA